MRFINRLLLIVAIVVLAFLGVSVIGVQVLGQSQDISRLATDLESVSSMTWRLQSLTYQILVTDQLSTVVPTWRQIAAQLPQRLDEITSRPGAQRLAAGTPEFATALERMSALISALQTQASLLDEALSTLTEEFTDFPSGSLNTLIREQSSYPAMRVQSTADTVAVYLDDTLQAVINRTNVQLDEARTQAIRTMGIVFFSVVGAASGLVIAMILAFTRALRRRFAAIGNSMEQLAAGDLTVELRRDSRDEVAELAGHIQNYVDEFSRVVGDIKQIAASAEDLRSDLLAASEESSASITQIGGNISSIGSTIGDLDGTIEQTGAKLDDINRSIRELEEQIEHQTRSVEESSSAVEEMTASVNSVSRIAADRQEAAVRLKTVADEGHANIQVTDDKVTAIAESVEEILGIITVINTIASQTSILSMNAAIEAAHAGEYGRGFSVVAAEIRRLSESTNQNAKRIKEQLQRVAELATDTKDMSETTRESFASVETEVESTAAALNEISATMRELADGTEAVLAATQRAGEMTQAIRSDATTVASRNEDITRDMRHVREISTSVRGGIQEIDVGTKEINQMVGNLSNVTSEMTDQIDLLGRSVHRFRTHGDEEGARPERVGSSVEREAGSGSEDGEQGADGANPEMLEPVDDESDLPSELLPHDEERPGSE
ncbi:MAG: methyl-accepting chemotaxis protein [Spirochaetota bacterium]